MKDGMIHIESFAELTPILAAVMRQELTSRQREILLLLYRDGLTVSQCAKALCVSPSTVCRTRDRGIVRLRKHLQYAGKTKTDA